MLRLARIVLMWLLCAALPLQGATAATMVLCGSGTGHEHAAMSTSTDPASAHPHHGADADHHHAVAKPAANTGDPTDGADSQTCSVCASCCVGAGAVVQRFSFFEPVALAGSFALPIGSGIAVYLTGGLERPPRPFLA